jgi:hypothetical protein
MTHTYRGSMATATTLRRVFTWRHACHCSSIRAAVGTGMFSGYGPLFTELFPAAIRNSAMGAAFNLARGVQFFTPVVITLVAWHYGLGGGIALAILFALLTGAWI